MRPSSGGTLGEGVPWLLNYHRRLRRVYDRLCSLPSGQRLSLREAAGIAGMHPNAFTRYCTRTLGFSYTKFAQLAALERAIEMMRQHNYSAEEVSWRCGFRSRSGFERCFRRHLGVTPAAYRRRIRDGDPSGRAPDTG
jgi:AraC-like DNA-binding protein